MFYNDSYLHETSNIQNDRQFGGPKLYINQKSSCSVLMQSQCLLSQWNSVECILNLKFSPSI